MTASGTSFATLRHRVYGSALAASIAIGASFSAQTAIADSHSDIIVSHGYNFFGDLAYPADYPHLNYVNPDAPKGGEISVWFPGTFDSFNVYSRKGRAGYLSQIPFESLMFTPADDINAQYGL
ncbi:MAG: hypothetical protein AAF386_05710 [Pseudomonadota bacterium]